MLILSDKYMALLTVVLQSPVTLIPFQPKAKLCDSTLSVSYAVNVQLIKAVKFSCAHEGIGVHDKLELRCVILNAFPCRRKNPRTTKRIH